MSLQATMSVFLASQAETSMLMARSRFLSVVFSPFLSFAPKKTAGSFLCSFFFQIGFPPTPQAALEANLPPKEAGIHDRQTESTSN